MNSSTVLMLLIMVGIGYVAHPIVWPHIDGDQVAETKVKSEAAKKPVAPEVKESVEAVVEPEVVELVEEEVVVEASDDSPRIIEEATEPMDEEEAVEVVVEEIVPVVPEVEVVDEATLVAAMKQSVRAGEVTEFKFEDVTAWGMGSDEVFEGKVYKSGTAKVNMTTVLGVNEHGVKALYADGKIVRWVKAVSRAQIK